MIDVSNKIFGMFSISIIAILQLYAWYMGHNGVIFAFSSVIIGGVVGALLGIKININEFMRRDKK